MIVLDKKQPERPRFLITLRLHIITFHIVKLKWIRHSWRQRISLGVFFRIAFGLPVPPMATPETLVRHDHIRIGLVIFMVITIERLLRRRRRRWLH
jgi:hypothetical protein